MRAEGRLKFGIDIETASISKLLSTVKNLKLGDEIKKSFEAGFKDVDKLMQEISKKQSGLTSQSNVSEHKEVEVLIKRAADLQKQVTIELQKQLGLRMQEKGYGLEAQAMNQKELVTLQAKLQNKQYDIQAAQQQAAQLRTVAQIEKERIANAARIEELRKNAAANDNDGRTLKAIQDRVATEKKLIAELEIRKAAEEKIKDIRVKMTDLESQIKDRTSRGKNVKDEAEAYRLLDEQLKQATSQYKNMENQQKANTQAARDYQKQQDESHSRVAAGVENIINKMKRLAEFTVAAFAIRYIRQFVNEGLRFIRELDKSLTEIATVTGQTRDQMWGMADEFNRMGRELGKTTNEITQASVIFYRQGLNTNQVLQMVRASTISAAIANTSAAEASNRLTAALRGYNMEADQAMSVADKLASLAAKSASSFDELSYAIKLVA